MKKFITLLVFYVACCHPQPVPTPPPSPLQGDMRLSIPDGGSEYGLRFCPASMTVSYSDICDGMFTRSGLACAHCTGADSCYDKVDSVYCARGKVGCLQDDTCGHVKDGATGYWQQNIDWKHSSIQLAAGTP